MCKSFLNRDFFAHLQKKYQDQIKTIIINQGIFLLGYFWHVTNIDFFYELFDKFVCFNKSFCYKNRTDKPEFGPYHPSAFAATLEVYFL